MENSSQILGTEAEYTLYTGYSVRQEGSGRARVEVGEDIMNWSKLRRGNPTAERYSVI